MAVDLNALMSRVANLEIASLMALASPPAAVDAKPYFRHVQEAFPYFVNRIDQFGIGSDSQDFDTASIPIIMRLVILHTTGGFDGERDDTLNTFIPQVIEYFNERELLIDDDYPDEILHLESARIVNCTGYREFQHAGIGGFQIGCEFTLRCEFEYQIIQAYH